MSRGRGAESPLDRTGRYLCLLLRHKPWEAGIALDEHGWADVEELIAAVARSRPMNREILEEIVRTDSKQRYSFNEDHSLIRANQGHSIPVDVELEEVEPPAKLYHGTGKKSCEAIEREGLKSMSRLYVHLSADPETAIRVGQRHGTPVVYEVNCTAMRQNNIPFYRSVNGVWLTKAVPPEYLTKNL